MGPALQYRVPFLKNSSYCVSDYCIVFLPICTALHGLLFFVVMLSPALQVGKSNGSGISDVKVEVLQSVHCLNILLHVLCDRELVLALI